MIRSPPLAASGTVLVHVGAVFQVRPIEKVPTRRARLGLVTGLPSVIELVTVEVADLLPFGAWAGEREHDDLMDSDLPPDSVLGQGDG